MSAVGVNARTSDASLTEREPISALAERVARDHDLWPVPTAGTRIERDGNAWVITKGTYRLEIGRADGEASISLRDFDAESILALWRVGLVYLRDDHSLIPSSTVVGGARVVFRGAELGEYTVLQEGPIVVEETSIGSHSRLSGAIAVLGSALSSHVIVDSTDGAVHLHRIAAESFLRIYGSVTIGRHTQIGSHCSFSSGWRHPEIAPLGPFSSRESQLGLQIGESNFFGQGVHVLGSATRVGRGCVVAPGSVILNAEVDAELVWGNPLRRAPIDQGLSGLSDDECFAAGAQHGPPAALLPLYGDVDVARLTRTTFDLSYPRYAHSPHPTSPGLRAFHRGALRAYFDGSPLWAKATIGAAREEGAVTSFLVSLSEAEASTPLTPPDPVQYGDALHRALSDALRAPWVDGADHPQPVRLETAAPATASRSDATDSDVVARVRVLVGEYMGPARARKLGLDVPLHAAGLDSLQIAEITARIAEAFGATLDLFEEKSLRRIAAALARTHAPRAPHDGGAFDAR